MQMSAHCIAESQEKRIGYEAQREAAVEGRSVQGDEAEVAGRAPFLSQPAGRVQSNNNTLTKPFLDHRLSYKENWRGPRIC